jgi:hypothetical protein
MTTVLEDAASEGASRSSSPLSNLQSPVHITGRRSMSPRSTLIPKGQSASPTALTPQKSRQPSWWSLTARHATSPRKLRHRRKILAVINSSQTASIPLSGIPSSLPTPLTLGEGRRQQHGLQMVVTGVGGNRFDPGRNITRAEFAAVAVRALGLPAGSGESKSPTLKQMNGTAHTLRPPYLTGSLPAAATGCSIRGRHYPRTGDDAHRKGDEADRA